jgi:uncharacterized membrane protein YeaQ/YmgE (transglycosylase-associated protein family)
MLSRTWLDCSRVGENPPWGGRPLLLFVTATIGALVVILIAQQVA